MSQSIPTRVFPRDFKNLELAHSVVDSDSHVLPPTPYPQGESLSVVEENEVK